MEALHFYTLTTSTYLSLQALPLLLTPNLIFTLLNTPSEPRNMTSFELYLSRTLALALLTLAALTILLSGLLPLGGPSQNKYAEGEGLEEDPYAYPTIFVTTTYHGLSAFYLYTQISWGGFSFGYGSGMLASSVLFALGTWIVVFGSEKGKISRKTGADKRTSGFLIPNTQSARYKKKEWKKEH